MKLTELEEDELNLLIGQMRHMGDNYMAIGYGTKYLAEYMTKFANRLQKLLNGEYDIAYKKPDLEVEKQ